MLREILTPSKRKESLILVYPLSRIGPCHLQDQILDLLVGLRTARPLALLAPVVLLCDQISIPAQNSVGSHDGPEIFEDRSSQWLPLGGETLSLVIGELDALVTKLLAGCRSRS